MRASLLAATGENGCACATMHEALIYARCRVARLCCVTSMALICYEMRRVIRGDGAHNAQVIDYSVITRAGTTAVAAYSAPTYTL